MSDVFILGAGFSRAISPAMPVLTDLGQAVRTHLGLPDPAGDPIQQDLELWLTYLSHDHPWQTDAQNLRNHALLLELSRAIGEVLDECTLTARQSPCPDWLMDLVGWWHGQQSAVLTLNYDTLVERALQADPDRRKKVSLMHVYPVVLTPAWQRVAGLLSGPPEDTLKLFKLHGSVNWRYSGSKAYFGETIYMVSTAGWSPDPDTTAAEAEDAVPVQDKVPLIVPPVAEKLPFFQHETIRGVWSQAAIALQGASRVFSLGYSLPVTDITFRYFLNDSGQKRTVPFYPVNRSPDTLAHFRKLLPPCYEVRDDFIGGDPIPALAHALASGTI